MEKNTITVYVDINQDSANRVISKKQTTSVANYTANVTSYMSNLTSVEVAVNNNNWSSNTFELYELWIDVDYTVPTTPSGTFNIKLGNTTINNIYLGATKINKVYIGTNLVYEN